LVFGNTEPSKKEWAMRRFLMAAAVAATPVTISAPTGAQAQYNSGGYSGSLANPPRAYTAPVQAAPAAPAYRPFFYTPPGYQGGGYYDYRRYGPPNTRDALDTCAYC
jgi:hypothetical protein